MTTQPDGPPAAPQHRDATDAEARALASGLRLRILRMCLDEPLTNREIAAGLGRNPATVLHHVRTLVDTGILEPQEVRRGRRGARCVRRPSRVSRGMESRGRGRGHARWTECASPRMPSGASSFMCPRRIFSSFGNGGKNSGGGGCPGARSGMFGGAEVKAERLCA